MLARLSRGVGWLTLDRPSALNALDIDMIRSLAAALERWRSDPSVACIVLDSTSERAFCAGGDVRALHASLSQGDSSHAAAFFREEYALNAAIAEYPKPVVAIADGVTMGGGIGLAGHASYRVVTERSRLAMPETQIGLTPDVGGSWLLARAPGRIGEYFALTGLPLGAADAIAAGLADVFVSTAAVAELRAALDSAEEPALDPRDLLVPHDPGPGEIEELMPIMAEAFAADTVIDILDRLRGLGSDDARIVAARLRQMSPTSLVVTLAAIRRARELPDLRAALVQEYGLVLWFALTQPDLVEGVRALLVDKDRAPNWDPPTVEAVAAPTAAAALAFTPDQPLF